MAADFSDIVDAIKKAVRKFNKNIPASQLAISKAIDKELRRLDVNDDRIKPTVANLKIVAGIKNKLLNVILTEKYLKNVKEYLAAFNTVSQLHAEYWRSIDKKFRPSSILKGIKQIAVQDTIQKLTEAGLQNNVGRPISDILTQNITHGGSYYEMITGLRKMINGKPGQPGLLVKHVSGVGLDAINQYSRNYTQIASADIGFEWYGYRNTLIVTSRPFCRSMTERRYFHVSEIPGILKAKGLTYIEPKTGQRKKVPLNAKTGLPDGMYATTTAENFLTLLGGYNCGHQAGPVSAELVQAQAPKLYEEITNSDVYKRWVKANKKAS